MAEVASKVVLNAKPPNAGKGRVKGVPNKTTALLKDAILKAATDAGNGDMAAYLAQQARDNPGPFLSLLGKVLPMQVVGDAENPITVRHIMLTALGPKPDGE